MKIGVMKIGGNITQSKSIKTASNFDIFSLMPILMGAGHEINIITSITRNTKINKPMRFHDVMKVDRSLKGLDCLMVFNGPINFFGGSESPETMKTFEIISKCDCPVYYMLTDGRFLLGQIWPQAQLKPWHTKYNEEDHHIDRPDIFYISQGHNLDKLWERLCSRNPSRFPAILRGNLKHFPIDWAINLDEKYSNTKEWLDDLIPFGDRQYDLMYGAANRDRYRENRLQHFYSDIPGEEDQLSIQIFGSLKFRDGKKNGSVPHRQFIKNMQKTKATVIVGDKFYCDNFFTLRMHESIYAGCITFIDEEFDPEHKFYGKNNCPSSRMEGHLAGLANFLYVSSAKEVRSKIRGLTENRFRILQEFQMYTLQEMHDADAYKRALTEIVEAPRN